MTADQLFRWFCDDYVQEMPAGAKNHLCWRVVIRRLYRSYTAAASEKGADPYGPEEFLRRLLKTYPRATVSGWRWVDREWEKEIDGLMAPRAMEPLPPRPRTFRERARKYA